MHTIIRDNYDPKLGEYHETILIDEARRKTWLFDCDGVFTDITKIVVVSERGDSEEYAASQKWLTLELEALEAADIALQDNIDAEATTRETADETLQDNIDNEEADRIAADTEIWDEIEAIEAASDVVDIVGTYEELEDYDTSALKDNDIIKVLQDETHDDAIAYYRWNDSSDEFVFVGVEGPYYTASETDTLLAGKQDKLIAGSNIQIAADGKTISATDTTYTAGTNVQISAGNVISATDTTYSAFTGATSSVAGAAGLVPAPTTSDPDKFLKGDGTWGTISQYTPTVFYIDKVLPYFGNTSFVTDVHVYKDSALTETATLQELYDAMDAGNTALVYDAATNGAKVYTTLYAFHSPHNGNPDSIGDYLYFAGDDGTVISANPQGFSTNDAAVFNTDVYGLYSVNVMSGATSGHAGYMGLAPTPASADRTKFLRGDGTWATPTDTTYSDFGGATAQQAGTHGLVPAPTTSDPDKFLKGDGTWGTVTTNALLIKEWS